MDTLKEQFQRLLLSTERKGVVEFINWLETTDFYTAPASRNNHGAKESGLLEHSLAVADRLLSKRINPFVGLVHDICKANYYAKEKKTLPKKDELGNLIYDNSGKKIWEDTLVYTIQDQFPLGHGEKSLYLVQKFIELTDEEAAAIRWHMGGFDDAARGGFTSSQAMSAAMEKYPLVVALHISDLEACYFDKK